MTCSNIFWIFVGLLEKDTMRLLCGLTLFRSGSLPYEGGGSVSMLTPSEGHSVPAISLTERRFPLSGTRPKKKNLTFTRILPSRPPNEGVVVQEMYRGETSKTVFKKTPTHLKRIFALKRKKSAEDADCSDSNTQQQRFSLPHSPIISRCVGIFLWYRALLVDTSSGMNAIAWWEGGGR